jgi:hypothetical protein
VSEKDYRLVEDYTYAWTKGEFDYRITVPTGFTYDGASVPRVAWTVSGIRPDGLIRAAALIHDWIYNFKGLLPEGSHEFLDAEGRWQTVYGRWSREDTDRLFGRIMRESGVPKFKRRMAYRAVRLFGWLYWYH